MHNTVRYIDPFKKTGMVILLHVESPETITSKESLNDVPVMYLGVKNTGQNVYNYHRKVCVCVVVF